MTAINTGEARLTRVRWAIVFLSVLASLMAIELCLRVRPLPMALGPFWSYHPLLGWTQIPNARFHRDFEIAFNAMGFRDREHARAKPSGTVRILFVGDSMLEAVQVPFESTFYQRLERQLNQFDSSHRYEVINMGVGDFGTAQACLTLQHYGWLYDPDIVVLQIFPLNDVTNNQIHYADQYGSPNDRLRPYFAIHRGRLVQTAVYPVPTFMRRHLALYGLFERCCAWGQSELRRRGWIKSRPSVVQELEKKEEQMELGLYIHAGAGDYPPRWQEGLDITQAIVLRMKNECHRRNTVFLAAVIPWEAQVNRQMWGSFVEGTPAHQVLAGGRCRPERLLAKGFRQDRVDYALALPVMERHPESWRYIDGHLNLEGHRLVSELLFKRFVRDRMVPVNRGEKNVADHANIDIAVRHQNRMTASYQEAVASAPQQPVQR